MPSIMDCKSSESLYVHVYLIALFASVGRECGKRTRVFLAMQMEILQLSYWVVMMADQPDVCDTPGALEALLEDLCQLLTAV